MIMKVTELRALVGAPSDPNIFGFDSATTFLAWLSNITIFSHSRSFEMIKNVIMFTFWRRKGFLSVVKFCLLVLSILQILDYPLRNYLEVKSMFKNFSMAILVKSNIHLYKTRKIRIFTCTRRKCFFLGGSMDSSDNTLPLRNHWVVKRHVKKI